MSTGSDPRPARVRPGRDSLRSNRKKTVTVARKLTAAEPGQVNTHWRTYFLAALVETSNVSASAATAGVSPSRAYKVRQDDPEFAAQWRVALAHGYDNLEMELLGYLRNPAPATKMDVTGAIRLLAMHRSTVAAQRALIDQRSESDVLESLDAMIEDMRQRQLAHIETEALHESTLRAATHTRTVLSAQALPGPADAE